MITKEEFDVIMERLMGGECLKFAIPSDHTKFYIAYNKEFKEFIIKISKITIRCDEIEYTDNLIDFRWKGFSIGWVFASYLEPYEVKVEE